MSEDARARVAAHLRALSEVVVTAEADPGAWEELAARLEAVLAGAPTVAPTTRYERTQLDRPGEMLVGHPMFERASAVYPPVRTSLEGRSVEGAVRFGASWEGPVGAVHGGFLAAAFDLVLSELAVATLGRCVTRSLRLRYLRPVPVGELVRLDATAGERDGRLLEVTGTASVGGRATTRAVAQFAAVSSRA